MKITWELVGMCTLLGLVLSMISAAIMNINWGFINKIWFFLISICTIGCVVFYAITI